MSSKEIDENGVKKLREVSRDLKVVGEIMKHENWGTTAERVIDHAKTVDAVLGQE